MCTNRNELPRRRIEFFLFRVLQTKEIEEKMKNFGESALRNFSMDGPSSIYEFEGENYKDKEKVELFSVFLS